VTSQGTATGRLSKAIAAGNLKLIRQAALEVPVVPLADAARIMAVIARVEPQHFEAAALRWVGRLVTEHPSLTLDDLQQTVAALTDMRRSTAAAVEQLLAIAR
jgi:hypothetical protein